MPSLAAGSPRSGNRSEPVGSAAGGSGRGRLAHEPAEAVENPVQFMDLEHDCLMAVAEHLSVSNLVRLAATCHTLRRVVAEAQPTAPLFRWIAIRSWGQSMADAEPYKGDWRGLCFDDNARNSVASVVLNVPIAALQWPEDTFAQYHPHRRTLELAGCSFQVSVGFLFQQDGRFGPTLDVAFDLLTPVEQAVQLPFHILMALNRRDPSAEDDQKSHMFSTYCNFSADNTLLLFKNCASCSALLTERLGYVFESADPLGSNGDGDREDNTKHVQLRLDLLRVWQLPLGEEPQSGRRATNRRVPVITCYCAPTAELGCPEHAVKAVIRRCWSSSPVVKEVAWRYLWHLICTARFYQQDKLEKLCRMLAALGAVQLLLASCAGSDLGVAATSLRIICTMADVEENAEMLRQQHAIDIMTQLNFSTTHPSIRRGTGEAIASLVPLDTEGLAIIRSLKLL